MEPPSFSTGVSVAATLNPLPRPSVITTTNVIVAQGPNANAALTATLAPRPQPQQPPPQQQQQSQPQMTPEKPDHHLMAKFGSPLTLDSSPASSHASPMQVPNGANSSSPSPPLGPSTAAVSSPSVPIKIKSAPKPQSGMNGGRWTEQEHQSFLAGLRLYGREWKKVASKIKTRTSAQIRSHAQKYFAKLARDDEAKRSGFFGSPQRPSAIPGTTSLDGSQHYSSDGGMSNNSSAGSSPSAVHRDQEEVRGESPASISMTYQSQSRSPPMSRMGFDKVVPISKKRSRSRSFSPVRDSSPTKSKRTKQAQDSEALPSQEELLEKVSPNVRRRLSSLIEAEICALQVLSCCAFLQKQEKQRKQQKATGTSAVSPSVAPSAFSSKNSMSLAIITESRPIY